MAAILQIVASVGSTTSLLDLNDNPSGILVRRGGAGSLTLADVNAGDNAMPVWTGSGGASVPEATTRTITVPVTLLGASVDAVGTKVSSLVKLVGQPWVLRVRRSGATVDGWIRCYPTIPTLDTDITGSHGGGVATGIITAQTEPYAYGARVDKTSTTVPVQDASTAGAFVLDVTGVAGDAPTPAVIRCTDAALIGAAHGTLFAVRRTGTPTSLTGIAVQAETGTGIVLGTNVTATDPFVDATLSGGNGVRYSYTSAYTAASGQGRLTFGGGITGAEAPGLYKLLVRARRSTADEFTFTPYLAGFTYTLDSVLFPAGGTNTRMIDLGIVQLPTGQPQQLAAPTAVVIGAEPPTIVVDVFKTTGTAAATLDLDYFLLVPCDEDAGVIYQATAAAASSYLTIDGYAQDAYLTTGDPFLATSTAQSTAGMKLDYVGGVPRLYPNVTNRLFVVAGFNSAGSPPALGLTPAFLVSHWPRYTWLP